LLWSCSNRSICHSERSFAERNAVEESLIAVICAMRRDYHFWIYIVTNRNHSVLYIGVTNSLSRRTWNHREGVCASFPARYQCQKLIYYEHYPDIRDAIARESQLKKWSRAKKIALINRMNPRWLDLGVDVLQDR
jgi:putative endonuclease